jgi:translation initiation factor 5
MHPIKYFGFELGSQVKGDATTDRYIVNGAHDAEKLQNVLDGFINKFVLCGSCKNPETDIIISKDDVITKNCKACGAITQADMAHKLIPYIIKSAATSKKSKKDRKGKKEDITESTESIQQMDDDEEADDAEADQAFTQKINMEAALLTESNTALGDDNDWAVDTSEEAVAARMKDLAVKGAVAKLMDAGDDEKDPYEDFGDFVLEHKSDAKSIIQKAQELEVRSDKAATILAQTLFDQNILDQIPAQLPLIKSFVKTEKEQKGFIGGLERLIALSFPKELFPKTALILKAFYDVDILEEDTLLSWGEKVSKKYIERNISRKIHEKAEPFIKWLQDAEEESDED